MVLKTFSAFPRLIGSRGFFICKLLTICYFKEKNGKYVQLK